ncbi:hypothetical protein HAX54_012625 [Datura stramonium]|uniref:Uncharacterized protein n=1 Tax=Datura stramonium TaxID=4076 RepID=A0ABS8RXL7_DATST|nr:hypothetical protein [Datura stramonium]
MFILKEEFYCKETQKQCDRGKVAKLLANARNNIVNMDDKHRHKDRVVVKAMTNEGSGGGFGWCWKMMMAAAEKRAAGMVVEFEYPNNCSTISYTTNNRNARLPSTVKDDRILSEGDILEEEPIKDPCRLNYKYYDRLYGWRSEKR